MFIGVLSFSFVSGSMASLISNYDFQNATLQEKVNILNQIHKEYCIPLEVYINCKKHLEYNHTFN